MQVSFERVEPCVLVANVQVESKQVKSAYNEFVNKYRKTLKMPGFRPGKVPTSVILQHYRTSIEAEVSNSIVEASLKDMYKKSYNDPDYNLMQFTSGQPEIVEISNVNQDTDLSFKIKFNVLPEVELKDLKDVNVTLYSVDQNSYDAYFNDYVELLRYQHSEFNDVEDGVVEENTKIVIDFEGKVDGVAFAGGSAKDHNIYVNGDGGMIPGFVSQIKGHKVGETFDINVVFPEEYHEDSLKGKPAVFTITVKKVSVANLLSDEELCKELKVESLDKLKKEEENHYKNRCKMQVDNLNLANIKSTLGNLYSDIEVPQSRIDEQYSYMASDYLNKYGGFNLKPEDKKKILATVVENLRKQVAEGDVIKSIIDEYILTLYSEQLNVKAAIEEQFEPKLSVAIKEIVDEADNEEITEERVRKNSNIMTSLSYSINNEILCDLFKERLNVTWESMTYKDILGQHLLYLSI